MRHEQVGRPAGAEAADVAAFWRSYYEAAEEISDCATIGTVSEPESRFHYAVTEASIIQALARQFPIPPNRRMAKILQQRREWRVLDIGSGAGHWIDFYRSVYFAAHVTGVEIASKSAAFLRVKYEAQPVDIVEADISVTPLHTEPFDIVSAIGVMFHIVDDERWYCAISNLAASLRPGGLMLVGGEFGTETKDVQFHKTDSFTSWREHDALDASANRVNKRVRSLERWQMAAKDHGLEQVDLIRTLADPALSTPENDLLVLRSSRA